MPLNRFFKTALFLCASSVSVFAATPDSSIILVHYGQSNAGITPGGANIISGRAGETVRATPVVAPVAGTVAVQYLQRVEVPARTTQAQPANTVPEHVTASPISAVLRSGVPASTAFGDGMAFEPKGGFAFLAGSLVGEEGGALGNTYFSFKLAAEKGYVFELAAISARFRAPRFNAGSGEFIWELRSSADNFASVLARSATTEPNASVESGVLPLARPLAIGEKGVEFRIYISRSAGVSGIAGIVRLDNVNLRGLVKPVGAAAEAVQSTKTVAAPQKPVVLPAAEPIAAEAYAAVYMPNDGKGTIGWRGAVPDVAMTALIAAEDDFAARNAQSVVLPAALAFRDALAGKNPPAVIVRGEAKGGQPFIGATGNANSVGLHLKDGQKTQIYHNLVNSIREMVKLAAAQGMPVKAIYIPFTHQEADRSMKGEVYLAQLKHFMSDVESDLKPLGIPVFWLLDQAGGTTGEGGGGNWENRLVLQQAADEAANVFFTGPRYPYPIFDNIHWTSEGKVLYGELLGIALAELYQGKAFPFARVKSAKAAGNAVRLAFDSVHPLVFDATQFPIVASVNGFTLSGVTNGAKIVSAEITAPREVTVTFDKMPEGANARLGYAYRPRHRELDKGTPDVPDWAISNGALREDWTPPSKFIPGRPINKWVPAFEVRFADIR